jgi:hypothetical protein
MVPAVARRSKRFFVDFAVAGAVQSRIGMTVVLRDAEDYPL